MWIELSETVNQINLHSLFTLNIWSQQHQSLTINICESGLDLNKGEKVKRLLDTTRENKRAITMSEMQTACMFWKKKNRRCKNKNPKGRTENYTEKNPKHQEWPQASGNQPSYPARFCICYGTDYDCWAPLAVCFFERNYPQRLAFASHPSRCCYRIEQNWRRVRTLRPHQRCLIPL